MTETPDTSPQPRPSLLDRPLEELEQIAAERAPDDVDALDEPTPLELAQIAVAAMSDDELRALPEVQAVLDDPDVEVRDIREDLEAAALGAMLEAEREVAARVLADTENAAADTEAGA